VLAYLERWGAYGKQPLHDIIQHIELPQKGRFNAAAWGDAVLRHGPKMARLVKFAGDMPQPLKDGGGRWSYTLTRAEIAKNAYARGKENPQLAALCFGFGWDNQQFESVLREIAAYREKYAGNDNKKPDGRIPEIAIDGAAFGKPGHRFYKLPDGDVRGLVLGEFTDCCQHLAGEGKGCARHGFMSPESGFYVVADKEKDEIIAQSWAWRGTEGELVLDSLESLNGHMKGGQWRSLCDEFARAAAADETAAVTAVHVGMGGATPEGLGYETAGTSDLINGPAQPVDYKGYRDSKSQYCVAMMPRRGLR
jgi:hypothetical protein